MKANLIRDESVDDLKRLFEMERDIPYRIPLSCTEEDHCCSGKHERLLKAFQAAGYVARYRICWFKWSNISLPLDVASAPHDDDCTHLYLELEIHGDWRVIDATWDPGLASVFSINKWTEPLEMSIAVRPTKILSPTESSQYMKSLTAHDAEMDLKKHRSFYQNINTWFEQLRDSVILK